MRRMAGAIERAIEAITIHEKDAAARWAAAWGMLCGIKTKAVLVRRSEVIRMHALSDAELGAVSIAFPAASAPAEPDSATLLPASQDHHVGESASPG